VGLSAALDEAVAWHDVECASYTADLELWRDLADERPGPVLELGCGTGRVALELAARGHDVTGLDADSALVRALAARARARDLRVRAEVGDARSLSLERAFGLVIAPMQVMQLLGGRDGRRRALCAVRSHLARGGRFAAALADPWEGASSEELLPPLPDVLEEDGWVFQSTPVGLRAEGGATVIERLRQSVSPEGELAESVGVVRLEAVGPGELEEEARALGFRVLERRWVPETDGYVGSAVVALEAA